METGYWYDFVHWERDVAVVCVCVCVCVVACDRQWPRADLLGRGCGVLYESGNCLVTGHSGPCWTPSSVLRAPFGDFRPLVLVCCRAVLLLLLLLFGLFLSAKFRVPYVNC